MIALNVALMAAAVVTAVAPLAWAIELLGRRTADQAI